MNFWVSVMLLDSVLSFDVRTVQGWFAAAPEVVSNSLTHAHGHHHGHDHKIDMEHPLLALNMTILSIAVKERYFLKKRFSNLCGPLLFAIVLLSLTVLFLSFYGFECTFQSMFECCIMPLYCVIAVFIG